ncbi:MAG: hypothetical protein PUA93_05105 [Eubacteriales bacterium]|nr:hypothetical protein [Eubacteriales bacterium]
MKKQIGFLFFSVLTLLASCGGNNSSSVKPSTEKPSVSSKASSSPKESTGSVPSSTYTTKVLKPDGTPLAGTQVQWCSGTFCMTPVMTDSEGVASRVLEDGKEYFVHLPSLSEEYTYDGNTTKQDETKKDLTITLFPVTSISDNTITAAGYYLTSFSKKVSSVTYSLTLPAGSYTLYSFNDYGEASITNDVDPKITIKNGEETLASDNDSGTGKNFSVSLTAAASTTYSLTIECETTMKMNLPFAIKLAA